MTALLALAIGGVGIGTAEFAAMGVLPEVATSFDAPVSSASAIISVYAIGVVIGAPLLTVLGGRLPRKVLLAVLVVLLGVGGIVSAVAPTFGVLLGGRFLTGLPHGAFFGVAAVVAGQIVPKERRGRAIAIVMSGLTVSAIIAVPFATFLSQNIGWRAAFVLISGLAVASVVLLLAFVPPVRAGSEAGMLAELRSVGRWQVLLTFGIVTLGFSGVFAVYSYVTPIVTEVAGVSDRASLVMLALFGIGMTVGNQLGGHLSERSQNGTLAGSFALLFVVLATFPLTMHDPVSVGVSIALLGIGGFAMVPPLTARMLDSAGPAKSLAASFTQAGFNLANALGAWAAGLVVAGGHRWEATAWLGVGLTLIGFLVMVIAVVTAHIGRSGVAEA